MERISQTDRLYNLLSDGAAHSTVEILNKVYGVDHSGYANIHGRITDIRKKYHLNIINFKDDKIKTLTYYQIIKMEENRPPIISYHDKAIEDINRLPVQDKLII